MILNTQSPQSKQFAFGATLIIPKSVNQQIERQLTCLLEGRATVHPDAKVIELAQKYHASDILFPRANFSDIGKFLAGMSKGFAENAKPDICTLSRMSLGDPRFNEHGLHTIQMDMIPAGKGDPLPFWLQIPVELRRYPIRGLKQRVLSVFQGSPLTISIPQAEKQGVQAANAFLA